MPEGYNSCGEGMTGLFVKNSEVKFVTQTVAALQLLKTKPRGKMLIDGICETLKQTNKEIRIDPAEGVGGQAGSGWDPIDFLIKWSTSQHNDPENWDQLNGVPPFIILGHELVHALHTITGTANYKDKGGKVYDRHTSNAIEETRTVGLGPWADDPLTENGLREEWNIGRRQTFQGVGPDRLLKGTNYA